MTRGAHSSIFHEPCSDGRNRDIFPLPLLSEEAQEHSFVSRSVKRRVLRRIKICRRVNLAIQALNSLYFGSSVPKVEEVHDLSSLPMAQRLCIQDIVKKVSAFGACPTTASSSGALQVNLAFREPPRTELGSLASLCEIELPEGLDAMKYDLSQMGFLLHEDKWRFRHLDPAEWRPRQRAAGVDYSGLFLTLRAQPYPWALAELVAAQLRSTWPNT